MTGSPPVHPAIPSFTVGFHARPTDKASIKAWIAKKVRYRSPERIRRRLVWEMVRAQTALTDLKPIKTHPDVKLARQNAQAHLDWATATKAELLRLYPDARSQYRPQPRPRRPNRMRVGLLGREARLFKERKPVDDD